MGKLEAFGMCKPSVSPRSDANLLRAKCFQLTMKG